MITFLINPPCEADPDARLNGKRLLVRGSSIKRGSSRIYLCRKTAFVGVHVTDRPV